jgi:hypothetical protein
MKPGFGLGASAKRTRGITFPRTRNTLGGDDTDCPIWVGTTLKWKGPLDTVGNSAPYSAERAGLTWPLVGRAESVPAKFSPQLPTRQLPRTYLNLETWIHLINKHLSDL